MNARRFVPAVVAALALLGLSSWSPPAPAAPAVTMTQPDLHFHFVAPDRFERIDPPNPGGLFGFKSTLADASTMIVSIDPMGGTIDRHRATASELVPSRFGFPAGTPIALEEATWRSFVLDAMRVELATEGQTLLVFVVQVPLSPEAVQVTVAASPAHEKEAREVLRSVVTSIDGKTDWLTDSERSYKLGVSLGSALGIIIGLTLYFRTQKRRSASMGARIRSELATAESLTLPELVAKVGLRDGFLSRGKVMNVVNPMVAAGELLQEEPPGTTMKTRLSVLRFRLLRTGGDSSSISS
jgi:hypothetical protein